MLHGLARLGVGQVYELAARCVDPQGQGAAIVESVKAASDVYAPLSGDVVEVNDAVVQDPALVNSDPLGAGWLYRLKLSNPADFDALMDEAAYAKLIG